jgi:hypothetical protein
MPCVAADAGARILEWLVLQASGGEPHGAPVLEEELAVRGNEMRHPLAPPDVAVQPEAAVHRVDHSVSAPLELPVWYRRAGDFRVRFAT